MKYLNGFLMLVMFVAFTACGGGGGSKADLLTQNAWMVDFDAMLESMPEAQKKLMTDERKKKARESMEKGTITFKNDGTMSSTDPSGKAQTGTWSLSDDGNSMTWTDDKTKKETVNKVVELSSGKLVIELTQGEQSMKMSFKAAK